MFDPSAYRVVLFDQRNCGRSTPPASPLTTDLAKNNTANLIGDIELLREHLGIDRWMLFGGSWGSTLALAYAEGHPDRVTEITLWGVTTGRRKEFDWLFRGGVAVLFPEQWERLCNSLPAAERESDIVAAYYRLLNDRDPAIREQAALAWCRWESATPRWPPTVSLSPRFNGPDFRMSFARLVTHYVHHDAWLDDGVLIHNACTLANIPGVMVNGRYDLQAPIGWAYDLKRAWPRAELVIVDNAGHDSSNALVTEQLIRATNHFA
jgi:proline iminopeptidase